jgi:peptidoglycan hydrolase-like protein with peptidoglycan-binding domain
MYINGTTTPFTATTSILITNIVNYNPIASFTVSAINDLLVTFTDTSSDPNSGTPLSDEWDYTWDFGDGTTLTAKKATLGGTITHTYSTANTYPVTLTVTDRAANTSKSEVSNINVTVPIVNTGGFSYGGGGSYWATPVPMIAGVSTSTLTTIQTTKPSTPSTNKEVSVKHEFIYNLSIGSRGNDITALQKILKYYGYYTFTTTTGYFGPVTKEAVIEYQKDNNITPYSGIVGPKTRVALNTLQGITVSTETAMYPEIVVIKNNQTISKEINKQAKTLTSVPTVTIPAKKEANFFKKLINYIKSTYSNLENAAPVTQ